MRLDELVNSALIGTSRQAPQIAPGDDPLGEALAGLQKAQAEDQLLGAAAIIATYEACGTVAGPAPAIGEPAAADERPACTPRAHDLLGQVLAMSNTPVKQQLLSQWLAAANRAGAGRAGVRVWHAQLPALLEYGAGNRAVRPLILSVIDRRGEWLMQLNPRWQFGAAADEPVERIWTTGSREQRAAALRQVRQTDAAAGRALVASTWSEDGAEERAAFVAAMETGLSVDDEPLLEGALDDRSKQVRAAAAARLARLPQSALVKRMIERVEPLLRLDAGTKGGLVRRAKAGAIEVTLPPDQYDPAWGRDGITEKPADRMGRRQWWLLQMLRAIPPGHWSQRWELAPADCIAAATGEFGGLLKQAWIEATLAVGDSAWAKALLAAPAEENARGLLIPLVGHLPAEQQQLTVAQLARDDLQHLPMLLDAMTTPLDAAATRAVVEAVRGQSKSGGGYNYVAAGVIERLGLSAAPEMYDELAEILSGDAWQGLGKAITSCLELIQVRRDIQRELGT